MKSSDLSSEEKQYNDEVLLLDGLYEFHSDNFEQLTENDQKAIRMYYLIGEDVPENIFEYRSALILKDVAIEAKAKSAYQHLLQIAGIKK